ncbi:hypothetical protein CRUP_016429 [Coryphaenoides rupestris]|nr:hypothetical protein CRUP_016429 [Coryphaenoides rupestris]
MTSNSNSNGSSSSSPSSTSTPADMINLRLILVSGKTKEFLFSPNDSAADIAKHVYGNWPMDWEQEQVTSPNILRLIYQGRFLHGNVTLGDWEQEQVTSPNILRLIYQGRFLHGNWEIIT